MENGQADAAFVQMVQQSAAQVAGEGDGFISTAEMMEISQIAAAQAAAAAEQQTQQMGTWIIGGAAIVAALILMN